MRLKGISFIERHVEKLVAGVFGVAALAVIALQFGRPTVVKVDSQSLAPDQAYAKIADKAKQLDGRLQDKDAPDQMKKFEVPDIKALLDKQMSKGVAPSPTLPKPFGRPLGEGLARNRDMPDPDLPRVAVVTPPAPSKPVAAVFGGTIDPMVVATTPALAPLVPTQQPYDKQAVSIEAVFPSAEMIKRLEADPDGDGPLKPVPAFWWKSRVEALDVVLERQEAKDDGTFGEPETVAPMPGQFAATLRDELKTDPGANFSEIVRAARERRRDVVQPPYYPLIAGEPWHRPEGNAGGAAVGMSPEQITLKQHEAEGLDKQIQTLKAERDKQPDPKKGPGKAGPAPQPAGGVGGGGGMFRAVPSGSSTDDDSTGDSSTGGSTGGGIRGMFAPKGPVSQAKGGPAPTSATPAAPGAKEKEKVDPEKAAEERRKAQFDKRIKEAEDKKEKIENELRAAGVDVGGEKPKGQPVAAAKPEDLKPIETGEDLLIWAHDVTAAPGKAYRYRLRLAVTNPLYGNSRQLHADAQKGAESPVTLSDPSPWSDPVRVGSDTRVFFTSAFAQAAGTQGAPGGPDAMGASVELWKFYYGFWRKVKATLKPGDALAASLTVPKEFTKVWEIKPGEKTGEAALGAEQPAPDKVPIDLGGFLLDVAPVALEGAGQGKGWQVVFRDGGGRVLVRWPDQDSSNAERRVLEASEAAGGRLAPVRPGAGVGKPGKSDTPTQPEAAPNKGAPPKLRG